MNKVLIATHVKFWLENKGSSKRIASIVKYLLVQDIEMYVYYSGFVDKDTIVFVEKTYNGIHFYADNYYLKFKYSKFLKRTFDKIIKFLSKKYRYGMYFGNIQPKGFSGKYALHRKWFFNKLVKTILPDVVIIEYLSLAYLIENIYSEVDSNIKLVVDTHDVLHLRNESFIDAGISHWVNITREIEVNYLKKFDVILAIQENEEKILKEMLPDKRILKVPYSYDSFKFKRKVSSPIVIGFIGTGSPENIDAILIFIDNVWRDLKIKYESNLCLYIYGSICSRLSTEFLGEGVFLRGEFENLKQVYEDIDIFINPVRAGGGLKIKNVETICHSIPLVTTPCGAQGLEEAVRLGVIFSCETFSEQFNKICDLVDSLELRIEISNKAYNYAISTFSERECYKDLIEFL